MRKVLVAFICLVGAVSAPAAAQELYRLESAAGAFIAHLPGRPKYEAVPISNGAFTLHQWLYDTPNTAYLVSYIDYARGHVQRNGLQFVLNSLTKGLHTDRIPVSERQITHDGHAARDVVVRTNDGFILRQRHMMVGDRAYIWNYVGAPGSETSPNVQEFFDSLQLRR